MTCLRSSTWAAASLIILAGAATTANAQTSTANIQSKDTVIAVAGEAFAANGFHARMLGKNYRDEWTTKIRVPVLDLNTFAGGVKATKIGGGKQTRSLRLANADSAEYVFRPVYKAGTNLPDQFKGTIIWWIVRDAGSASHPGAAVTAVPLMDLTGVLHPTPKFVVLPDDPRLGEFRKEFAGVLGTIEDYPKVPKSGEMFGGAKDFMDADKFLDAINKSPSTQPDAHTLLKARLADLLLGDNDRHPDQWKWARMSKDSTAPLEPVARDRDKVFVSYGGVLMGIARKMIPSLITFRGTYSDPTALFENATDFDRRILGGLSKAEWLATANDLKSRITNDVIDKTIMTMPKEYIASSGDLTEAMRGRRDNLPEVAMLYYRELFALATVQGTDAADRATVYRLPDGKVRVTLLAGGDAPWFDRTYDPEDTHEIRVYLHEGDDSAVVTGDVQSSIPVRIIGGNGDNTLIDRSTVNGARNPTMLYDEGKVTGVKYARDTVDENKDEATALNHYYNRRPWVHAFGTMLPPQKDYGTTTKPVVGLKTGHGLGLVPKVGIARYNYGFRTVPYSSMMQADIAMSTATRGIKATAQYDKRFESSDIHVPVLAQVSQLEVTQFNGFGNRVEESSDKFFEVKQTQWQLNPAIGFSFAPESDITLGPVVRYTKTDSAETFLTDLHPYGFRTYAQAGMRAALHFDSKPVSNDSMKPRVLLDFAGSAYPGGTLDVATAYESLEGSAVSFMTIGLPNRPVLALRAGGKKLFGNFPYFDAAFLGGGSSFRVDHRQRYAGDASVYGSSELRVPVAKFPLVLPLDVGVLGFADVGRVYVDGDSPGGWHNAEGGGFWVGLVNPGLNFNVLFTNRSDKRVIVNLGFTY